MSGTITPVDEFTATIADILNGDDGNFATFHTPLQGLTNRTHNLHLTLTSRGVPRLRAVADSAALSALTGMAPGEHAVVKNQGLYQYDPASSAPLAAPFVLASAGGGRWVHADLLAVGVASGLAGLDAGARVPSQNLRGHLISSATSTTNPSASGTISSSGPFGVAIASASLSVGQAWEFFSTFSFKKTSGTGSDGVSAFLALLVVQPDASGAPVRGSNVWTSPASVGAFLPYGTRGRFVATQAGTHQLHLTVASVTSSISYEMAAWSTDHYVMGSP